MGCSSLDERLVDALFVDWPTEKAAQKWVASVEKIGVYYATEVDYKTPDVQKQVSTMIDVDAEVVPNSPFKCWLRTYYMVSSEYEDDIKEAFGEDGFQYLENAVEFYAQEQVDRWATVENIAKTPIYRTLENLQNYGIKRYTTGSEEVQSEVRKLHQMVSQIGIFSEKAQIRILALGSELLGSREAKAALDNGREKGVCWFISRAIQIYCNRQQEAMKKEKENNE